MKKVRSIRSVMKSMARNEITLQLLDEVDTDEIKKFIHEDRLFTYLDFVDPDKITDAQRDHFFALVGDIADWWGYDQQAVKSKIYYDFMIEQVLDEFPSVSRGQMTKSMANDLIEYCILFCIEHGIPHRKGYTYMDRESSKIMFALTMKRMCWVCGAEHSDIAHYEAVGMGRNRQNINHTHHRFMCLCRWHHTLQHQMGADSFCHEYKFQPIKLDENQLKQLGMI